MGIGVDRLDEAMASIRAAAFVVGSDLDALAVPQLDALVRDLAATRACLDAVWVSVVAAVDRAQVARRSGARDTASFLAEVTGDRLGGARRDVDMAARLEDLTAVRDAFDAGELSKAKAEELSKLRDASAAQQAEIVRRAKRQNLKQVQDEVTRANHANRPQPTPPVVTTAFVHRDRDRVRVEATTNLVDGEWLDRALRAAGVDLDLPADLPGEQRLGQGLIALARHYLTTRPKTDHHPLSPANLYAVIDHTTLVSGQGSATLGSGAVIDAASAQRWGCDARISRVITDAAAQVLDVGRRTRLVTRGIAEVLLLDDGGCRFHGCTRPAWGCEAHHVQSWANGGDTSIGNLVLLCWYHHHLIHADHAWQLILHPNRTLTIAYHDRHIATTTPRGRTRRPPGTTGPPGDRGRPGGRERDHEQPDTATRPPLLPLTGH